MLMRYCPDCYRAVLFLPLSDVKISCNKRISFKILHYIYDQNYHCTYKKTIMKKTNLLLRKLLFLLPAMLIFHQAAGQYPGINDSIAKYRKGQLIILAKKGDKVQVEQIKHEFWFGCAISNSIAGNRMSESDKKQYKEKFLQNFNAGVTENALKWIDMEPQKGQPNYATVDGILKWTEENHIPLRGHNIFWGIPNRVQPWLKEMDDAELLKTLQQRAETITSRYKGRFAEYDLNNEMIHANYYEERFGPEITKKMADWAHNGDPNAKLFLNDYDILTGNKLPDYMAQIRKLLKLGVPIAGIGVQGHLHTETFDRNELRRALDSLSIFNIPIRITEFNIPGQRSKFHTEKILQMTPQEQEFNAKEIVDYYRICFAHPGVEGILMWGFWEGANWIPVSSLYRRDWSPTPAAEAYHNLIFKEWWTKTDGTTDKKGKFTTPAFYGRYKVTVNGVSKEVDLEKAKGSATVDFRKQK
jgi:GH35 family endo-1,4-beta-xylanase